MDALIEFVANNDRDDFHALLKSEKRKLSEILHSIVKKESLAEYVVAKSGCGDIVGDIVSVSQCKQLYYLLKKVSKEGPEGDKLFQFVHTADSKDLFMMMTDDSSLTEFLTHNVVMKRGLAEYVVSDMPNRDKVVSELTEDEVDTVYNVLKQVVSDPIAIKLYGDEVYVKPKPKTAGYVIRQDKNVDRIVNKFRGR